MNRTRKTTPNSMRRSMLFLGVILALLILTQGLSAQENKGAPQYKCPPCGCSADDKLVHGPGDCSNCRMKLINTVNPSEGLNYQNVTANQLCGMLKNNPDILLLDVRSKAEYEGRVTELKRFENSINIPITEIGQRLGELAEYKDKEILVHCSISARSPRVSQLLAENGFTKVRNLMGGLRLWNNTEASELPCKNELLIKPQ